MRYVIVVVVILIALTFTAPKGGQLENGDTCTATQQHVVKA